MSDKPTATPQGAIAEAPQKPTGVVESALGELSQKVTVMKHVGIEMGNLYEGIKEKNLEKIFDSFKAVFAIGFLGMLMSKEEFEGWKKERKDVEKNEGVKVTEVKNNVEIDGTIEKKQRFVNMKSIQWYNLETKKPFEQHKNGFAKKLKEKNVLPSQFIMEGSSDLYKEGITSFSSFKKTTEDRLVDESITDPQERERQAALILSCCAVGRFQIVPYYHFSKLGLATEGAEGLKNMYDFICSTEMQIILYEKITDSLWNKYKDPGLVAIEYYAGGKAAAEYKKNPNSPRLLKKQYGNHGSINNYAQRARGLYAENKEKYPQAREIDCLMMALEKIESSGTVIRDRFLGRNNLDIPNIPKPSKIESEKGSEMMFEGGIDLNLQKFMMEELSSKKGAEISAMNLEGNGGRSVLTYIPPGVDLKANNLKIIYHFHGTYSENVLKEDPEKYAQTVGWNRLKQTIEATDDLAERGENVILVYPLSKGPRHKPDDKKIEGKQYDRLWMAKNKIDENNAKVTDDFDKMHEEILKQTGIKKEQISKVEAQGHSAGGLALANIATSGTKLIDAYRFLDASYSGWAENCYEASRLNGKPDIYLLVAPTNLKTWPINTLKRSARWSKGLSEKGADGEYSTGIEGVYYYQVEAKHAEMPGKFTGWNPKQTT